MLWLSFQPFSRCWIVDLSLMQQRFTPIFLTNSASPYHCPCFVKQGSVHPFSKSGWLRNVIWRESPSYSSPPHRRYQCLVVTPNFQFSVIQPFFSIFSLPFRNMPLAFLDYPSFSIRFIIPLQWQYFEPGTFRQLRTSVLDYQITIYLDTTTRYPKRQFV